MPFRVLVAIAGVSMKYKIRETKSPAIRPHSHTNPDCKTQQQLAINAGAKSSKCQMAFMEIKV
jgi:hypothetical protein